MQIIRCLLIQFIIGLPIMTTKKSIPTIAIIGQSGSGKTTVIEKLIAYFSAKGLTVGAIKHTHQDFDIDPHGKDSHRFTNAGAPIVAITNDDSMAIIAKNLNQLTPQQAAPSLFESCDLIIIEGNKKGNYKKIEVIGTNNEIPLFQMGIDNIIALVTDKKFTTHLPIFSRNDIAGIAHFIETFFMISVKPQ